MKRKSNKSQYPGVTWDTKTPGWRVEVYTCGLRLYVGKYADEATAAAAHDAALWRWRGGDSKALENLNNPHLYSNPEQAPPDAETYLSPAALVRLEACQVEAALRASRSHPKNKVAKRKRPELSASGDSEGDATISDSKEDSDAEANDMLALDGHLHGSTKEGKLNASKQTTEIMQGSPHTSRPVTQPNPQGSKQTAENMQGSFHTSQPVTQPNPQGVLPQLPQQQPPAELQSSMAREQRAMENVVKAHSCMQARMADLQAVEQEQQLLQAKAEAARSEVALAKAAYVQALQAQLKILAE
ncbi:hypothetical protein DUNSADRAFT_3179 [Dunaliella salina]|uniref:AP2/ERF domain-containing protein n=1 Tax=Dunaliella salina TaxID=3046 RepID=A0ABQ7FY82_DUNSA|nr:hypothetical protein DUNSADRAFT_3179 [Dunaliella salina]|eukprot:KAF5838264.1 hypothetical protein DUNSADRAFT_3179 [Dunaliella salina]